MAIQFDGKGQSLPGEGQTPGAGEGGQAGDEPQYVTKEQLEAFGKQLVKRTAQSTKTIISGRVQQAIDQQMKRLTDAGVTLSAKDQAALQDQIIEDQLGDGEGEPPAQVPPDQQQEGRQGADPTSGFTPDQIAEFQKTNDTANALMDAYGVDLVETDEEIKMLDNSSGKAYLQSLPAALLAKQARLKEKGQETGQETPDETPPILPFMGGSGSKGNPIADENDPSKLIRLGLKQRKIRR